MKEKMASMRKTYFLAPSWELQPEDIILGSVIGDLKTPQRALSATEVTRYPDHQMQPPIEQKSCSGVLKQSRRWNVGLIATFLQVMTLGGELSYGSDSALKIEYPCDLMETRRLTPSLSYISKLSRDPGVRSYLKAGGLGTKAFVITGIKIAYNTTITTTEEKGQETKVQVAIDIPTTPVTVGPKASYVSTTYNKHTRIFPKPIVFAFQVEKIRLNRKGQLVNGEYVKGAMLGDDNALVDDFVIERAGNELEQDEIDDFGISQLSGVDEETGEDCSIIAPFDAVGSMDSS